MTTLDHDQHFIGRVTQKALIVRDNKVLLEECPETDELAAGKWDMPGGRLHEGEDPIEGLKREVEEEIGAKIVVQSISHTGVFTSLAGHPTFFIVYRSQLLEQNPVFQIQESEVGALQWVGKDEFETLPIIYPQYIPVIRSAFEAL